MKRALAPDAVLLDLDGTLYEYEDAHKSGLASLMVALERDYGLDTNTALKLFHEARDLVKERLKGSGSSHSRILYVQSLLDSLGLGGSPEQIQSLDNRYWHGYFNAMRIYPGAKEFLVELQIRAIPVAIVTDFTLDVQLKKLIHLGVSQFFSAIVTSEETGRDKPDSQMFLLALAKLKVSESESVWMVGDSESKDGLGAIKALDAQAFIIGKTEAYHPKLTSFKSFYELIDILKSPKG